eukprot:jgi/Tetstr1/456313/TSEL_004093.t1
MLAKEASEQSPYCSRKCVHKLYTQCGEALVDAVLDRALTVYSGNQNRFFDRLAQVLRGGYESASDKFDYMFDHGGYLRSFDHRGPIYTCGRAWEALHQVSKHRRLVIQRSVVDNEPTYIRQRKQYESRQTGPREHVRMFLEHFFSDDLGHVEIMPFHDGNSETFKKHLPPWMTKICVYYYYKSWAEDDNAILRDLATESEVKLASFDTFRRTWKEDFPDVTTPKVIAEQKVHLERVRQERGDLNNAVFQSRLGHGNFFFFEIDSMDSAKTLLSHWVRIPKTVKPDMLLKYHLTCVKYDGYRPDDIYYYTNTIPHDSSTTCTLIWITIMKIFSRISLALSRSSAYTIEAFLDLVAKAFSPTPEIAELAFSLDFFEWLRPHFQDHIQDISKPHKFEFTRDDAAASGGSLRTALWSNTPLSEPVQILKSAPTGTPEIRAGRPLLYALCDKKKPDATAPAEARHTMATNAYLNNAEAARVEAEVRAQVLQDDSAFRGVHADAKERLHDNTSPSDAKGSNLVVIDVSDTKGGKKPVDTSWDKCLTLPWKLVEAVPLSYAKAIHDASGSREVFNEDGTMVRKKWKALFAALLELRRAFVAGAEKAGELVPRFWSWPVIALLFTPADAPAQITHIDDGQAPNLQAIIACTCHYRGPEGHEDHRLTERTLAETDPGVADFIMSHQNLMQPLEDLERGMAVPEEDMPYMKQYHGYMFGSDTTHRGPVGVPVELPGGNSRPKCRGRGNVRLYGQGHLLGLPGRGRADDPTQYTPFLKAHNEALYQHITARSDAAEKRNHELAAQYVAHFGDRAVLPKHLYSDEDYAIIHASAKELRLVVEAAAPAAAAAASIPP